MVHFAVEMCVLTARGYRAWRVPGAFLTVTAARAAATTNAGDYRDVVAYCIVDRYGSIEGAWAVR